MPGVSDDLLAQGRVLADPTRHAVFLHLRDADAPRSVAELTDHFGLNHTAIRLHLTKLTEVGLVVGATDPPAGRGRPPTRYRTTPGGAERWTSANPYETLSMLLLELVSGDDDPREVGRRAGRRLAREHASDGDVVDVLTAVARRLGFEPHVEADEDGADVVLDRCPFTMAASSAPEVVCDLHLGIAEGIADEGGEPSAVSGLVVNPPSRAGCRIEISGDRPQVAQTG